MNVAVSPSWLAVIRVTYLTIMTASAAFIIGRIGISISHWPGPPTSWWWYFTSTPICDRSLQTRARKLKSWSCGGIAW